MGIFRRLAKFFRFGVDLAIDLGTANTLVWTSENGLVINEPSVIAVREDRQGTKRVIAVGEEAKRMMGIAPPEIKVIRPLKDGVIADFEATEAMLRYFIEKAIGRNTIVKPRVVIGIPGNITSVEKRAVVEAAESAGAAEVYLIEEPMAAAIGSGLPVAEPVGNMIVDIGGGTTEIAVISLAGIVASTAIKIAGDELDEAIARYIKNEYNLAIGIKTAERIKIEIGAAKELEPDKAMEITGSDAASGIPKQITITQKDVVKAIEPQVKEIVNAVKQTLEKTPPELSADIYERGIHLAGGGALLKGLDQVISDETGIDVKIAPEPVLAVVKGCAKALEDIDLLSRIGQVE